MQGAGSLELGEFNGKGPAGCAREKPPRGGAGDEALGRRKVGGRCFRLRNSHCQEATAADAAEEEAEAASSAPSMMGARKRPAAAVSKKAAASKAVAKKAAGGRLKKEPRLLGSLDFPGKPSTDWAPLVWRHFKIGHACATTGPLLCFWSGTKSVKNIRFECVCKVNICARLPMQMGCGYTLVSLLACGAVSGKEIASTRLSISRSLAPSMPGKNSPNTSRGLLRRLGAESGDVSRFYLV